VSAVAASAPDSALSVVVPTFNESENVDAMVAALEAALAGLDWEVIFVDDDSPDGTADRVRRIARANPRVRCIQRLGRRGLSSAAIEGILSSSSPFVAVMDGDLQHDERILPAMLRILREEDVDLVIGSRYAAGGSIGDWSRLRAWMSRFATRTARRLLPDGLTDPMSGFFMARRSAFEGSMRRLSGTGYKILLDVLASSPRALRFRELPYEFRGRRAGTSKVESVVLWEYLLLLLEKILGGRVPARFISFALVGGAGLVVHLAVLAAMLKLARVGFATGQATATVVAMTSNFLLNNALTYSDRRLRGIGLLTGLVSFYLICSIGALANVGVASFVFEKRYSWWAAGIAGVVVGTVWNYGMSGLFTWGQRRRGPAGPDAR